MRKILLFCAVAILSVSFVFPQGVFAEKESSIENIEKESSIEKKEKESVIRESAVLKNPLKDIPSIQAFFLAIISILLVFAVPFIVFFIIYAGFLYVTARGNAETIKKAHNALLYALIGGLLILGSRTLLTIITNTVEQIK